MQNFIYLRGLKSVNHTVFSVADGQKSYWHPEYTRHVPYSSGQQIKWSVINSVLQLLNEQNAPVIFQKSLEKGKTLKQKQILSSCDPTFTEELLRGWMRAENDARTIKRHSPLSISAMIPLHPFLAQLSDENINYDKSDFPELHPVKVFDNKNELNEEEITTFLEQNNRNLSRKDWIKPQGRVTGLFVYDIAIDKRTLFSVSLNQDEPALLPDTIKNFRIMDG